MFHAFDELQFFDETTKELIIDKFLNDKVLQNQGWSNVEEQRGSRIDKLTLNDLKESVNNYMDLSTFRMLSISEIDAEKSKNRGGQGR